MVVTDETPFRLHMPYSLCLCEITMPPLVTNASVKIFISPIMNIDSGFLKVTHKIKVFRWDENSNLHCILLKKLY